MKTSLFDYDLPKDRVAQSPLTPRDSSRLMILDRATGQIEHKIFREIADFLRKGDVLIFNDTKVFKARLIGTLPTPPMAWQASGKAEIFLIHPDGSGWLALGKPGKKLKPGTKVKFDQNLEATIINKNEDGTIKVKFNVSNKKLFALLPKIGEIPIPPYITKKPTAEQYQTVFAKHVGSVAAPTAGFHFTKSLLATIKKKGVRIKFITLHVGLGTFQPVKTETLEAHPIHSEFASVPADTLKAIAKAKNAGQRIIAVGTTTVRALEGLVTPKSLKNPKCQAGWVKLFIKPGYQFRHINALVTNFHLPKSTLLALVAAFLDKHPNKALQKIHQAYQVAINLKYRFYSFGDAMLIS